MGKVQHNKKRPTLSSRALDYRTNCVSEIDAEAEPEVALVQ